ncbi:cellulose binding domain-containing protein [Hymenobacter negativus]|uniref:T9SS type A sorting domain-containing protein n=1 Tax=Hymenobacter negativus TaxID=2795026 RepID=A0ABS3QIK5_9BACT|nr:cellulose binding domain-containing protein [Hymenobacter negativus]MBO2011071.1 T9SS type A sorting domain-containing protein [Hymenobacter negativus]
MKAKSTMLALALNFSSLGLFAQAPLVYSAENTGAASCTAPSLPSFSQLPAIEPLPDPFMWANGSGRSTRFSDWECRRNEIRAQIENYEIGTKPTKPQNITASYAAGVLTVNVTENGQTLTLTSQVSLPSGNGPFPAIIGMNSASGSVPASVFTGRNIARITFNHDQVTRYGNPQLSDPYYRLYPNQTLANSGQYSAWAWGVSRIIDGLELVQASLPIDLQHLGVTGCSYAGKMALFSGAFDERIALTIAQESGGGGAPAWRVSETLGAVEKLGATDYRWFRDDMQQFAGTNVAKLPEDHHELMAMIAPRALLVTGNTDFEWLANPAAYVSARAAHEVWKQFGIGDRFGFYIDGGHGHCAVPATQVPAMQAFVDKFLAGNTSVNTNITVHPYPLINYQRWYQWWGTGNPVLPPLPPEPLGKRIWLEAECATLGSSWDVVADTSAAAGAYVKVKSGLSSPAAAPSGAMSFLTTPFTIDSAGTYNFLARLNVPVGEDYGYWLKIDGGTFQSVSSQLATNPGFESGLSGWSTVNATGATISANTVAADAHSGTGSMKVVNPTAQPGNQWRVQVSSAAFPTTIGKQYVISYWVKAAAPGGSIRLSSGPSSPQYQGDQAIGTAWQQVTWTITASLTSTTFLFDMGQVANTYFIDDVSVKEVGGTAGWRWVKLRDAALSVGPHTLTIGYNTGGGTGLDKLLVTSSSLTITGKGLAADNCKTAQTIAFGALATRLYGDADFTLAATSSSGLPITYLSSDPSVATVTNGVVHLLKAGSTTITALQAGNATYQSAAVSQVLTVTPVQVSVLYQNGDAQPSDNYIRPNLQLVNGGTAAIPYQELTVRYWLTPETTGAVAADVSWAELGTSQVGVSYKTLPPALQGAYGYVEYSFLPGAGSLAAGANSGVILSNLHQASWGDFEETNDYSYATNTTYLPNSRIAVYRNGMLIAGTEPSTPVVASYAFKGFAENRSAALTTNSLQLGLQVNNLSNVPVAYSDLSVRYWLSPDGTSPMAAAVTYAPIGAGNTTVSTGQKGTETYLELGFAPALGMLAPLGTTGEVLVSVNKADWSSFSQANDYSYQPVGPLAENSHVTVYYKGQLLYGTEPGTATVAARGTGASPAPATAAASQSALLETYPNPVASEATVQFKPVQAGQALVQVYNSLGQLVTTLYDGTVEEGRAYQLPFAAQSLANGLYECRLVLNGKKLSKRMVISH